MKQDIDGASAGKPEKDTRALLLTSALSNFSKRGFKETTTRQITEALGMSPGSLYVYYESKLQLLREIVERGHRDLLDHLLAHVAEEKRSAVSALRELVKVYTAWHIEHHLEALVINREMPNLGRAEFGRIANLRNEITDIVRAAARAVAVDAPDTEVEYITRAIISVGRDVTSWHSSETARSPELTGDAYGELAVRMCNVH